MKNMLFAMTVFVLSLTSFAGDRLMVSCKNTSYSDLSKIEIIETDLAGQYQIIETSSDKNAPSVYSPVFGETEIKSNLMPELSSWNGYKRKLVREVTSSGTVYYSIVAQDECSENVVSVDCQENLD